MRKYMNTEKPIWFTETGFVDVGGGHGLYKGMLGEPKPALTAYRDILTKELSDVELVEQLHGNRGTGFLEGRGAPRLRAAASSSASAIAVERIGLSFVVRAISALSFFASVIVVIACARPRACRIQKSVRARPRPRRVARGR